MLKGKGVSNGIGFGKVVIIKDQDRTIEKRIVENPEQEMAKFKQAFDQVKEETKEIVSKLSGTEQEIMQAYLMIMEDPTLITETENAIQNLKYCAEYAALMEHKLRNTSFA